MSARGIITSLTLSSPNLSRLDSICRSGAERSWCGGRFSSIAFFDALTNLRRRGVAAHEGAKPLEQRLPLVVLAGPAMLIIAASA